MVQHYLSEIRLSDISSLCRDKILVGWDIVNFMYIDMTIYVVTQLWMSHMNHLTTSDDAPFSISSMSHEHDPPMMMMMLLVMLDAWMFTLRYQHLSTRFH